MELTDKVRREIDEMPYEEMLKLWKTAHLKINPLFDEPSASYFINSMCAKSREKDNERVH